MMDVFKKNRHRVSCLLLFACLITLSCTDFIARVDLQGDWTCLRSGKIVLYCRPSGFSGVPSPASDERDSLVSQQNFYYTVICDSIQKTFDDEVVIYLYNSDEAAEHIGTSGGGHAIPKLNAIYFTYLPGQREHTDPYGIENPLMGAHELAHVISHRTLGYPGTKLMSEGYANWLDGGYAGYGIAEIIRHYRDNEPEKIMTPDRL
ncbi:MAG: hypothetical protein JXR21_00780, partial [Candidatus Marinimicrobia bacterium]|nr:hypothetical protein [Candidatus Neomarinimicrobiota bacterium]